MGIDVFRWLAGKYYGKPKEVNIGEIFEAAADFQIRKLAFNTCVNLIANAVGVCEFKTFRRNEEIRDQEYYLWNIEPNINQNSTAFLHKLIHRLCCDNEALVIATKHRDGHEMLVVADSFQPGDKYPAKMNTYTDVKVGDYEYSKTFKESEVLHFQLHESDISKAIAALYDSYEKLISVTQNNYIRAKGVHLKVKVDQVAAGEEKFEAHFMQMMEDNVKPFIQKENGVLPEFDGYEYTEMFKERSSDTEGVKNIRELYEDIFAFTARCFGIPPVLQTGDVAGTADAMTRWLTTCIDPICDQIQEEIVRKRYGFDSWKEGTFLQIDTTKIIHFDMFANAANVEKLIGSGCFSINDVLAAAGLPEINEPWAKKHWLTLNIGTIEAAAHAAENPKEGGNET